MVSGLIAAGSALLSSAPTWLPWLAAGGAAGAAGASLLTGNDNAAPPAPQINLPSRPAAAKLPAQKPAQKTTGQQSFLSGAAAAQQAAATTPTGVGGKKLLGA